MSVIRLHDVDEVATKSDIALLRSEIDVVRSEVTGDIDGLRTELKGDIAALRGEVKTDIAELRAELKGDVAALQKTMLTWMLTLSVAMIGAIAGVGFLN